MRVLALETTEAVGSVAAVLGDNLLFELSLDPRRRSAQSLAPGLGTVLKEVGWQTTDVDLVATCVGPGSFTGLRVGITTAKAFAYCAGADVLGVDTLEVIAAAAPPEVRALSVAVDAQRGQVVAGAFRRAEGGHLAALGPSELLDVAAWLGGLAPGTLVSGPILRKLAGRLPDHVTPLEPSCWLPTAAAVGRLAVRHYRAGQRNDLWSLVPRYCRRSAAEEKWEQKQRAKQPGQDAEDP